MEIRLRAGEEQVTTAVQFANDMEMVLDGMEKLVNFLQRMGVFARASGQQLNLVELLPIGPNPGTGGGGAGNAGGATGNGPEPPSRTLAQSLRWTERESVVPVYGKRISSLHLSVFLGRATAAAAYGLHHLI